MDDDVFFKVHDTRIIDYKTQTKKEYHRSDAYDQYA
jgi:hypothetical protein